MKNSICRKALAALLCLVLAALSLAACGQPAAPSSAAALPPDPPAAGSIAPAPVSSSVPEPEPRRVVDFEELKEQNEDTVAWIEVPGTVIDYPIMNTTDNAYYLDHDETKAYNKYGAIFIDMSNPDDFSYPVMVAYGHFTPEETHFTQLHRYEDPDYFEQFREVYVYLPGAQQSYEIVAAMLVGEENILYNKDYTKAADMRGFVEWIKENKDPGANINMTGAGPGDQYLVLSTCTQAEYWSDQRYVVVARLVETIE